MLRPVLTAIRFRPPVAIARLGNSSSPLEAFTWTEDPRLFGAGKTIIVPTVSLSVDADGNVETYLPESIRFRDGGAIRPVCPFLELEADSGNGFKPLTGSLMKEAGLPLSQLSFQITAANLKAQRRTEDSACGFEARALVRGDNHARHHLRAWSHAQEGNLLVLPERPITLGHFQVMRPSAAPPASGVCLDTIRVRFTPATGEVYGPPIAAVSTTLGSRQSWTIVKEENRILNPAASWTSFDFDRRPHMTPTPGDTYDGESDLDRGNVSWGVVDDTCDIVIVATLAAATKTSVATARIVVGPPDFAPDRRPFYSVADDLADRNPESLSKPLANASREEKREAIADLFRRIYETASMVNLERSRARAVVVNDGEKNPDGFPAIDDNTMTQKDMIDGKHLLSARASLEATMPAGAGANNAPMLPLAEYASLRHGEMAQPAVLFPFLRENRGRLRQILRPPFARTSDLQATPASQTPFEFRDPRFPRSYSFDMRMPPYIRDADFAPLSISRQQWDLLWDYLEEESKSGDPPVS